MGREVALSQTADREVLRLFPPVRAADASRIRARHLPETLRARDLVHASAVVKTCRLLHAGISFPSLRNLQCARTNLPAIRAPEADRQSRHCRRRSRW